MTAVRRAAKDMIELMARNLQFCAENLYKVADRVDGAHRDDMIVEPLKALELTRIFAEHSVNFRVSAYQFETDLFGLPPPSPPASQPSPDDRSLMPDDVPLQLNPSAVEESRPRPDCADEEPDKKKQRRV